MHIKTFLYSCMSVSQEGHFFCVTSLLSKFFLKKNKTPTSLHTRKEISLTGSRSGPASCCDSLSLLLDHAGWLPSVMVFSEARLFLC